MSNQLFTIKCNDVIYRLYTDLEKAKNELKNIYKRTPDYKHCGYHISVYNLNLVDNEYIFSNIIYTYTFDKFSNNNI
jgi:hypothetical protein